MARTLVALFLRLVLAAGLLAAVGAHLGYVGAPAAFDSLTWWTARLWGFAPASIQPVLVWVVVVLELILGLLLLLGLRTRPVALTTGVLFAGVAIAMAARSGAAAPFQAAVLPVLGVALSIHSIGAGRVSFDGN